jgi:hypothetical protein
MKIYVKNGTRLTNHLCNDCVEVVSIKSDTEGRDFQRCMKLKTRIDRPVTNCTGYMLDERAACDYKSAWQLVQIKDIWICCPPGDNAYDYARTTYHKRYPQEDY